MNLFTTIRKGMLKREYVSRELEEKALTDEQLDRLADRLEQKEKQKVEIISKPIKRSIQIGIILLGIVAYIIMLWLCSDMEPEDKYRYVTSLTVSCVILFELLFKFILNRIDQSVNGDWRSENKMIDYEKERRRLLLEELHWHQNTPMINIINYYYKQQKDGSLQLTSSGLDEIFVRLEDDNIVLLEDVDKFVIPKNIIISCEKIQKNITIEAMFWTRRTPFNQPPYSNYIEELGNEKLSLKEYRELKFTKNGKEYEIHIPEYDYLTFKNAIGE